MENFRSYDDASAMRNRSYEHAMIARPLIITIKEFEDAQKELADLRKRADEIHESIIMKNNERDERISSEELSILMFPLDNLNRQIKEVEEQLRNALVVKSPQCMEECEIEAKTSGDNSISSIVEESDTSGIIDKAFSFVKGSVRADAKPGYRTPFYAIVNGEFIGYNRLLMKGWSLVDNNGDIIDDINIAWSYNKEIIKRDNINAIQRMRLDFPNAFKPWTEEEKSQLEEMYLTEKLSIEDISDRIGRSVKGISMQIRKQFAKLTDYEMTPISIATVMPSDIPDEQLGDYLNKIEVLEKWIRDVKKYALEQTLKNGIYIDGYEIKTTTHNLFDDGTNALNFIKEKFPQYYDRCVQIKGYDYILNHIKDEEFMEALADYTTPEERNKLIKSKSNDIA